MNRRSLSEMLTELVESVRPTGAAADNVAAYVHTLGK